MISIDKVTYQYPSSGQRVIDSFDLKFEEGRVCGLLGENGAGKTTLLGLMCGILRPTGGSLTLDGDDISKRGVRALQEIYYVPDESTLPHISLSSYVSINAPFYPRFSREALDDNLRTFGLGGDLRRLDELSLGQRKKVILSFAMASGAKVILMDEPTNGLDIPSKSIFRKILAKSMDDSRLFVISTHQVHDVEQVLDQIVIMDNHRIILNATEAEITDRFSFSVEPMSDIPADVIYSEPSLGGMAVIRPRTGDDDTQVNLELLFNAAINGKLS